MVERSYPDMATALVEFFRWAMREGPWDGGDLDGGSVQDKAESLGLIVKTQYDAEKHGMQSEFETGDDWFEYAPGLLSIAQGSPGCGEWQAIETAPRDGTIILLGNYGSEARPAYYGMASKTFSAGADKRFPWVFLDNTNGVNQCTDDETGATHWMPLPAPPSSVSSTHSQTAED